MSNPTVLALVDSFVVSLEVEIRKAALAAVSQALGASAPVKALVVAKPAKAAATNPAAKRAKAKAAPKAKKAAANKRVRRTPADLDRDVGRLVSYVRSNNGATNEKIRAALGFEKTTWTQTLNKALETKQVIKKGERRNTTLHLADK